MAPTAPSAPLAPPWAAVAPPEGSFPEFPVSWYFFGTLAELARGPVSREVFGERLVAFRTQGGRFAVLSARCSHLGTDLGCGRVVGETVQCPYHNWNYAADGRCVAIPASATIPAFARQRTYPVATRHGHLYVFNGREPLFPLPFYADVSPDDLRCGAPHAAVLDCPWYMIGGNAFDGQHFNASHDREMVGEAVIDCPSPYSRRASARFAVKGDSWQDRFTRWLAGDEVALSITDHGGNFMLVTATFRRTRSYGLVVTSPLPNQQVLVRVMVLKRRSGSVLGRIFLDGASLAIRRRFINNFLSADAVRLGGVRYRPSRLIDADRVMAEYFGWLAVVAQGRPFHGSAPTLTPRRETAGTFS